MSLCENNEFACLVAIGDVPELDWSGDQSALTNPGSRADHNIFCELMADNYFQQFIPGPTHVVGNKLDLLLLTGQRSLPTMFQHFISGRVYFLPIPTLLNS